MGESETNKNMESTRKFRKWRRSLKKKKKKLSFCTPYSNSVLTHMSIQTQKEWNTKGDILKWVLVVLFSTYSINWDWSFEASKRTLKHHKSIHTVWLVCYVFKYLFWLLIKIIIFFIINHIIIQLIKKHYCNNTRIL